MQNSIAKNPSQFSKNYVVLLSILVITFLIYRNSLSGVLLWWDDNKYVFENEQIKSLSFDNISNMFGTFTLGDYNPLVSLSFAIDYYLYGLHKASPMSYSGQGYHSTNLILHLLSVITLFFFCMQLSRSQRVSAVVATLFAIHPMNVESVAWVTERKDQLYVLFYLTAMLTYLTYLDRGAKKKHLILTGLFFLLSLLSKAMAVTLPLVLFMLDYYRNRKLNAKTIAEKLPFFILSIVFAVIAMNAQAHQSEVAGKPGSGSTLTDRILFASYGIVNYLTKAIIPFEMSAFYPFPEKTGGSYPMIFYTSLIIVMGLMFLVWRQRKNKTAVFGILFFSINIALVSQLIPFGQALMADRFTYLAYIGLFFSGAVMLENYFLIQSRKKRFIITSSLITYFLFLGATTYARTNVWQSTYALWEDVAKKFPDEQKVAEMCAGIYSRMGNFDGAIIHMNRSIALSKRFSTKQYSYRSFLYYNAGKLDSAMIDLNLLLEREPNNCGRAKLLHHRGKIYLKMKKKKEAVSDLQLSRQFSQGCPNFNSGELLSDIKIAEMLAENKERLN